jgi:hypothetical protein
LRYAPASCNALHVRVHACVPTVCILRIKLARALVWAPPCLSSSEKVAPWLSIRPDTAHHSGASDCCCWRYAAALHRAPTALRQRSSPPPKPRPAGRQPLGDTPADDDSRAGVCSSCCRYSSNDAMLEESWQLERPDDESHNSLEILLCHQNCCRRPVACQGA